MSGARASAHDAARGLRESARAAAARRNQTPRPDRAPGSPLQTIRRITVHKRKAGGLAMKSMTDTLLWVVGLLAFALGLWQLMVFLGSKDARGVPDMWSGTNHLWLAIVAAVVACVCVA